MIVPFRGTETELAETVSRLARVRHNPCDQIILVWNSADPPPPLVHHPEWLQICVASAEASSYSARNVGVAASESDWLLFIDADCSPNPEILDLYFPIGERSDEVGIVAGGIVGAPGSTVVERYACAREHLDQRHTLKLKPIGYGQTANLLMRARVWRALGGFAEGITSGRRRLLLARSTGGHQARIRARCGRRAPAPAIREGTLESIPAIRSGSALAARPLWRYLGRTLHPQFAKPGGSGAHESSEERPC